MSKVLSIKQPWASLIIEGFKPIENRTWKTNHRGKLLIHASATYDKVQNGSISQLLGAYRWATLTNEFINRYSKLPTSAIIGEVDLVDCVQGHDNLWADKWTEEDIWWFEANNKIPPTIWHWVLENPIMYDEPILNVKGKLNLWNYELD